MNKNRIVISQSLMKSYDSYSSEEMCGIQFDAFYIQKYIKQPISDSMALGNYFEFMATGQLPRDGKKPLPERTIKGHLTAPYKLAEQQAKKFKNFCQEKGITVLKTGLLYKRSLAEGTIDILAIFKNEEVVIDLKFTGKINNRWDKDGWDINTLHEKDYHMTQARMYHYLTGLPFYFWLFSSTNDQDTELIQVVIDKNDEKIFEERIQTYSQAIEEESIKGFKPYPDYKRCKQCPEGLSSQCPFKANAPITKTIYYTQTA